jgi:hypothetical protein
MQNIKYQFSHLSQTTDIISCKIVQKIGCDLDFTHRLSIRLGDALNDAPGKVVGNLWGREGVSSLIEQNDVSRNPFSKKFTSAVKTYLSTDFSVLDITIRIF